MLIPEYISLFVMRSRSIDSYNNELDTQRAQTDHVEFIKKYILCELVFLFVILCRNLANKYDAESLVVTT